MKNSIDLKGQTLTSSCLGRFMSKTLILNSFPNKRFFQNRLYTHPWASPAYQRVPWLTLEPLGAPGGPMGPTVANFPIFGKTFFQKKYPKIQNLNFGCENQSCSHRNSAHFGTHTVSWGPLSDSFPDFQFFGSWIQDPGCLLYTSPSPRDS